MRVGRYDYGRSANTHIEFTVRGGFVRVGIFDNPSPGWWYWKVWYGRGWQLRVGRFAIARSIAS